MNRRIPLFRTGTEEAELIRISLQNAGASVSRREFERLLSAFAQAVQDFVDRPSELSFRDRHVALRRLFNVAHDEKRDADGIRHELDKLSVELLKLLDERADRVIPQLLKQLPAVVPPNDSLLRSTATGHPYSWTRGQHLREWAKNIPDELLARAVSALVADGAMIVPGRKRPANKQSRSHVEPRIMGTVRGKADVNDRGGRPGNQTSRIVLIGRLAFAWETATGEFPKPSRSTTTPFGDLVHQVFDWIGERGAENALREYWNAFEKDIWVAD